MKLVVVGLFATACSHHIYSPPTQAYQLAPVTSLGDGAKALDLDASTHAQLWDPSVQAGTARIRTGLGHDVEVSAEGMAADVKDVSFYTGRAALRVNPNHGALSFTTGLGGGFSPKGGAFMALDAGVQVGYDNCYLVPIASAATFVSQPIVTRPIDVTDDPTMPTTHDYTTARRTVGSVIRIGLRLSLSPERCHRGKEVPWITAGFDQTTVIDATDDAELFGVGLGVSIPL